MTNTNPIHVTLRFLRRIFVILFLCIVLWTVLFGCHVEILQPQRLAQAKSAWESKNASHYEEVFTVSGFCGFPCFSEIKMEVMNNQVMSATSKTNFLPNDNPFKPVTQEQIASGKLQSYTIDALFQQAGSALKGMSAIALQNGDRRVYHIDYDPQLGFITRYEIDDCGQGGLLNSGMGDCNWRVTVKSINLIN